MVCDSFSDFGAPMLCTEGGFWYPRGCILEPFRDTRVAPNRKCARVKRSMCPVNRTCHKSAGTGHPKWAPRPPKVGIVANLGPKTMAFGGPWTPSRLAFSNICGTLVLTNTITRNLDFGGSWRQHFEAFGTSVCRLGFETPFLSVREASGALRWPWQAKPEF